jgi:hypothetical protein
MKIKNTLMGMSMVSVLSLAIAVQPLMASGTMTNSETNSTLIAGNPAHGTLSVYDDPLFVDEDVVSDIWALGANTSTVKPHEGSPCVIGVAGLVVGGIIGFKLYHLCKSKLGSPPADPPPTNPTNSPPSTNSTSSLRFHADSAKASLTDTTTYAFWMGIWAYYYPASCDCGSDDNISVSLTCTVSNNMVSGTNIVSCKTVDIVGPPSNSDGISLSDLMSDLHSERGLEMETPYGIYYSSNGVPVDAVAALQAFYRYVGDNGSIIVTQGTDLNITNRIMLQRRASIDGSDQSWVPVFITYVVGGGNYKVTLTDDDAPPIQGFYRFVIDTAPADINYF